MKTFLAILALLIPSTALSGGGEEPAHWYCHQAGYASKSAALIVSQVYISPHTDYDAVKDQFERVVEVVTEGTFTAEFDAACSKSSSEDDAKKERDKLIKKAKKKKLVVIEINFDPAWFP